MVQAAEGDKRVSKGRFFSSTSHNKQNSMSSMNRLNSSKSGRLRHHSNCWSTKLQTWNSSFAPQAGRKPGQKIRINTSPTFTVCRALKSWCVLQTKPQSPSRPPLQVMSPAGSKAISSGTDLGSLRSEEAGEYYFESPSESFTFGKVSELLCLLLKF